MKLLKKIFFTSSFCLIFLLSSIQSVSAARALINPVYYSNLGTYGGATTATDPNVVTNNDTSVTIRIEGLTANYCYLIGKGTTWKDHSFNGLQSGDRPTSDSQIHFWEGNNNEGGWSKKLYAAQAGGTLCGFVGKPDGSGPDNPANYVRADEKGVVWLYDMCENFEGVRTDCNEKFVLAKDYTFTIFHVTCFIQEDGINLDRGDHLPDEACDLEKARIKDGKPTLRIWGANGDFPEKYLNYDFTDETSGRHADAFGKITDCSGCSFQVYTAKSKTSGQFDINSNTVKTEFGDIPRDPVELATVVLRIALGAAGGLAFLLMIYGSLRLIFASGNPENVQHGREILTAAIIGLLVIIFSTFILQLVGISILGLKT